MDKLDRLSLSWRKWFYFQWMRHWEWKFHSEIRRKEWKNNIHRVLFPTQSCQFWDTETMPHKVTQVQTRSDEVTQGQIGTENVTQGQKRSDEVTSGSDNVWQGHTRSDEVTQGQIGTKKVTQSQKRTENVTQGQTRTEDITQGQTGSEDWGGHLRVRQWLTRSHKVRPEVMRSHKVRLDRDWKDHTRFKHFPTKFPTDLSGMANLTRWGRYLGRNLSKIYWSTFTLFTYSPHTKKSIEG